MIHAVVVLKEEHLEWVRNRIEGLAPKRTVPKEAEITTDFTEENLARWSEATIKSDFTLNENTFLVSTQLDAQHLADALELSDNEISCLVLGIDQFAGYGPRWMGEWIRASATLP